MSRSIFACAAVVVLAACDPLPTTIRITGDVREAIDEGAGPFAGAEIVYLDDDLEQLASDTTDATGHVSTRLPAGTSFHMVIGGEGHVASTFSGVSGFDEVFEVAPGTLFSVSEAEWADWTGRFAGCAGVGEGGAVIGEARALELTDPESGEHPSVNAGLAELTDAYTGEVYTACYLDEEGAAYDPDATRTGASALFGIFGVPEGLYILSMGLEVYPDAFTWDDTLVYVQDQGVAPRFPAWVHFPLP